MCSLIRCLLFTFLTISHSFANSNLYPSFTYSSSLSSPPIVSTSLATYEGFRQYIDDTEVRIFLGIPYALPPVGSLRFKKPVAISHPMGYIKATHLPPQCPHVSDSRVTLPWLSNRTMSEDCLYLNVWTPAVPLGDKLPVMVYLSGYSSSSSDLEVNNGLALAAADLMISNGMSSSVTENKDVVVVTFNRRDDFLGFFYNEKDGSRREGEEDDDRDNDAPSNLPAHDIILTLQWVQEFIGDFGGDPSRVTIFGQGNGAVVAELLTVIPKAKGLFARSIIQSMSPFIINPPEESLRVSKKLASLVGCMERQDKDKIDMNCMREKPLSELLIARAELTRDLAPEEAFRRVYDNDLYSETQIRDVYTGRAKRNPGEILRGTNLDEGAIFLYIDVPEYFQRGVQTNLNRTGAINILANALPKRIGLIPQEDLFRICNYYLANIDENDTKSLETALIAAMSATVTCVDGEYAALSGSSNVNPTYRYFFTQDSGYNPFGGWHLSTNFQEIQYVFGMPLLHPEYYTKDEQQFSRDIILSWSTFAYTGKPQYRGISWPLSDEMNRKFIELNAKTTSIGYGPTAKECDFWSTIRYRRNPKFCMKI